jgi:hypothetical protein
MILTNRRLRLLYLALAAMDMAVFLPWLTILVNFWAEHGDSHSVVLQSLLTQNPLLIFLVFWGIMILYMWITDLLNQWQISGGLYIIAILGVLAITSLLLVRFLLYSYMALNDFRWLQEIIDAFLNLILGIRGELLLILTNYFLWMRVARYTDRSLTFLAIGVSFRLGMLLVVLGATLLAYWSGQSYASLLYIVLFFAFGLSAVALARIDQKAIGSANSSGALLPWDRYAQIWLVIVSVLAASYAIATVYTPQTIRTFLGWFSPVARVLQWFVTGAVFFMFLLLTPFLEWLEKQIQEMVAHSQPMQQPQAVATPQPLPLQDVAQNYDLLRYCLVAIVIFVAVVLILLFLSRMVRRERVSEDEETATEGSIRPGGIRLGLDRLKDLFALLGRYGLGSQLLAAISVENIYANLSRLARKQGYPRRPSQGPDRYLPTLMQAFPGHEAELTTITAAYIRVRYAERPITPEELDDLRAAYGAVIAPPETPEKGGSRRAAT